MDLELQELLNIVKVGWPKEKKDINDLIKPYWNHRHGIVEARKVLFKNQQLIIPKSMRSEMLNRLHYNHLGIVKTQLKASELIYWPNINKEIIDIIKNCSSCLTYQNLNQKEPLVLREIPDRPWKSIAIDLFHFSGKDYLLIVDIYSKFPEIICLNKNTTADNVINKTKEVYFVQSIYSQ